jgi:hypothetical protein
MGHFCTTRPLIHWSYLPLTMPFQLRRSTQFSGQWDYAPQKRHTSVPQSQSAVESTMEF